MEQFKSLLKEEARISATLLIETIDMFSEQWEKENEELDEKS